MKPKEVVNEMRRVRDDLNRMRTALSMSGISEMGSSKKVVNDIDTLLSDSDDLRNDLMEKAEM